jgi:hypothetical protein
MVNLMVHVVSCCRTREEFCRRFLLLQKQWIACVINEGHNRGIKRGNKDAAYRREKGNAMPQSAKDAVAAVEQRRIAALIASDINALDEIIDEHCTHIESNGTSRTKAAFLQDVAKREFSFDLFEIIENHIRIIGDTAVVTGTYRNIVRVRGKQNPLKHARHLRVYVQSGGGWKLIAHQATAIASPLH